MSDPTKDSAMTDVINGIGQAHEEMKSTVNELESQVKKNGVESADTKAKFDKINEHMDELCEMKTWIEEQKKKQNRPGGSFDSDNPDEVSKARKTALYGKGGYVRSGDEAQLKSINVGTDANGGFAVPEEIDGAILELQRNASTMRQLCNVISIGTSDWKKLVNLQGAGTGWVGEAALRPDTTAPTLAQVTGVMGEIYANPKSTQEALDDIFFDVEAWLLGEIAEEFNTAENQAFVDGNGTNKPKGYLASTLSTAVDSARTFGELQNFVTGAAATLPTTSALFQDLLVNVVHSMKAGHRAQGLWMMNTLTLGTVRKFKDADNRMLWQPSLEAGVPDTLIGYGVASDEAMPAIGANALPIAFGDFKAGYTILDRMGIRVLRDPYVDKPHVTFYTTKRVGGQVIDSNAIKIVKCSV